MAIIRNYMHSVYGSFAENIKLFIHITFFVCLRIEKLADSNFFKCLIAIKCSESRVETLQIFLVCILSILS